ncbi:hypothetical protein [Terribacillus saccharophilus]|uniref:hypothetical protein n=1 Tax=Terribacillus saccharophilus TaxID=361277 RepID=UPI003982C046
MKEILQQVKDNLERTFDHPDSNDLTSSIELLEKAIDQYGDKGTMLHDAIRSLTHAQHARNQLEHAGDISSSASFGEAYNAIEQALSSYE